MADDRTAISELSTALGCLGHGTAGWAVLQRPAELLVPDHAWEQLERGLHDPRLQALAEQAFDNGAAFAAHADGLGGRRPRRIEWTGGQRPPGDQIVPADLRIDRVYLVSCKYLSNVVHNAAPSRVFEHLLRAGAGHDRSDWYQRVAPAEHGRLAEVAAAAVECPFPGVDRATAEDRLRLRDALRGFGRRWPVEAEPAYAALCERVAAASVAEWRRAAPDKASRERFVWRLLRLAAAPYFVVGSGRADALRLRIDTPWDFRQRFDLVSVDVAPAPAGQPQVSWSFTVFDRELGRDRTAAGHIEVRWSHGRFGGPPEAKVYLDTPHAQVPGYVDLT